VKQPIDLIGLILLVIGVGSLQFMLDNGNEKDWFSSPVIVVAALVSLVSITFLIPWELTDKHPVIDLRLFARRNFRVGTAVIGVAYFALSGVNIIFLPLNQIMLSGIPPSDLASASGLSNFVRTMSGSIATAMTVFLWNRRTDYHHAVLTEHIRDSAGAWTDYQTQLGNHGVSGTGAFEYVEHLITTQAMTLGVNDVFHVLGWMYVLLIPFIWLARPPFTARGADAAH
jgi:DHA2 family multidrug resistance protein